jgi:photosystem II stability/assembly factor-like uncharacterized protein
MRTMRLSHGQVLLATIAVLVTAALACNLNPVLKTTAPRIPAAEVIFTAPEAIIALAADKAENVYAVTIEGNLLKIAPDGKSEQLYSGLKRCGFSDRALTVLPNGDVVTNDCADKKDTLVKIDQGGNKTTLTQLEDSLISMTSDSSGKIYLGFWMSDGDINLNFNPSYLAGADYISGQVSVLGEDGNLDSLYEGGLPLSIAASEAGELYATLWGQAGRFRPESKNYSMCGPTKNFWIGLSDHVEIQHLARDRQDPIVGRGSNGVLSYIAVGKGRLLFAFGKFGEGECGIHQISQGSNPQRLSLTEDDVQKNITSLAVSDSNLYFSDADGNVYRIGLRDLVLSQEVSEVPVQATPTPAAKPPTWTPALPTKTPMPVANAQPPAATPIPPTKTPAPAAIDTPTTAPPTVETSALPLPVGNWQPIPDLPRHINALVVDPANSQILYAGTGDYAGSGSGVYKSEDAGLTWRSVSTGLPNKQVLALAFSHNGSPTLYAAVGSEVFASADGAQSWTRLGDTDFFGAYECLLRGAAGDRNVLFAVSRSHGIARSNDGGYAWLPVGEGLPGDEHSVYAMSLAIDPVDANVIYVGTGGFVGGGHGVYKSTDGGETFLPANQGMVDYRITALAVDAVQPQTVYAGGDGGDVFKSTDGGQTWSDLTGELPIRLSDHPTIRDIVTDPTMPETVYLLADNAGVLITRDGGTKWQVLGKPGEPDYLSFLAMTIIFDSQPEPVLVVGVESEGGWRYDATPPGPVPTATASSASAPLPPLPLGRWQPALDLPRQINTLVVDPSNPQVLYAGTGESGSGSGVYKSEDVGLTWQLAATGLPNEDVLALAISRDVPPTLYAAIGRDVFASIDGAQSWTHRGDSGIFSGFYRQLYITSGDSNVLFMVIRPGGLIRSNDGGYTWLPVGEGLPGDDHEVYVLSLAIDPTDADVVYAGTGAWVGGGHGVYKSTDGGETFAPANRGMLDYRISALAVDPGQPETLYAGGDSGELFKSTDGGQTWIDLTDNLRVQRYAQPRTIRGIVIDPAASETVYLLGDNAGVLVSHDGGETCRQFGKPGDHDQPTFSAWTVAFTPQPVLIVGLEREGGWQARATD